MARFTSGWLPIPREWTDPDHPIGRDGAASSVLIKLCLIANRVDTATLKQGQVMTSLGEIMGLTGLSQKQVRRALSALEEGHAVGTQRAHRGSTITILNYKEMFCINDEQGTQRARKGQHIGQGTRDKAAENNHKEDIYPPKSEPKPPRKATGGPIDSSDFSLAKDWHDWASKRLPTLKPALERAADVFRKAREVDGLSHDQLRALFEFVKKDGFWSTKVYSPLGLRQKSGNGLTKLENIQAASVPKAGSAAKIELVMLPDLMKEKRAPIAPEQLARLRSLVQKPRAVV